MSNTGNPPDDEQQLPTIPTDYGALLAMTRPLVVAEHTLRSWRGGEICRLDFGIPLMSPNCHVESTLRTGEIVHLDELASEIAGDEGRATEEKEAGTSSAEGVEDEPAEARSALPHTDSNLQIRIYIGMS